MLHSISSASLLFGAADGVRAADGARRPSEYSDGL